MNDNKESTQYIHYKICCSLLDRHTVFYTSININADARTTHIRITHLLKDWKNLLQDGSMYLTDQLAIMFMSQEKWMHKNLWDQNHTPPLFLSSNKKFCEEIRTRKEAILYPGSFCVSPLLCVNGKNRLGLSL